jgi:hypothetical protein
LQLSAEHAAALHHYLLRHLGQYAGDTEGSELVAAFILATAVAAAPPADAVIAALPVLRRMAVDASSTSSSPATSSTPGAGASIAARLLELFTGRALEGISGKDRAAAEAVLVGAAALDPGRPQPAAAIRAAALAALTPDVFAVLGAQNQADAFRVRPVGVMRSRLFAAHHPRILRIFSDTQL